MAVSFRNASKIQETITGNTTATEPASAASGDALIAIVVAASATTIGAPAGWTVPTGYNPTQGAADFMCCYILRGGSAPSLIWTFSGSSIYREIQIICLTGAAALSLDSNSAAGTTAVGKAPNPPATVAVAATSMAVACGCNWGGYASVSAMAGYTIRTDTTDGLYDAVMSTKSLSSSGSEDPAAYGGTWDSLNNTSDMWNGATLTFTDVSAAVVPSARFPNRGTRPAPFKPMGDAFRPAVYRGWR